MTKAPKKRPTVIMDRERLHRTNAEGCPACGRKFTLGDPVVMAFGDWGPEPRYVHEHEAVFDSRRGGYVAVRRE